MAEHSIYCQVQRLGPCTCGATPKGAAVSAAPPSVAASNTERVVFKCDNPGGCRFPKQPCLASCSLTVNLAPAAGVRVGHVSLPREVVSRAIEHLQSQATYTPSERNKEALLAVAGELLAHVSGVDVPLAPSTKGGA